jgi:cytochrome c553
VLLVTGLAAAIVLAREPAMAEPDPQPAAASDATPEPGGASAPPAEGQAGPPEPGTAAAAQASATGDPQAGAAKAAMCGGCHGPDGNSPAPMFPKLAGQRADYIAKQLRDFRSGRRVDPIMVGMVATLSEQDMADVAAHFESLDIRAGSADPKLVEAGRKLYREGRPEEGLLACIGCHGPDGAGFNGAIQGGFPAVGGQHPEYLEKQLKGFREGQRQNDWAGLMQTVASQLTDADIEAVTAYLTTLRGPDAQASAAE